MPPVLQQASVLNEEGGDHNESNIPIAIPDTGDAENVDTRPQHTGTDKCDESVKNSRFTWWTFIFPLFGIIIHLVDVGSDIKLAYDYYLEKKMLYSLLTIFFVYAPAIINMMMSFGMDKQNKESIDKKGFTAPIWKRKAWIKIPMFLLLSAPLFYGFSSLRYAYESQKKGNSEETRKRYYRKMTLEDKEFAMLKIVDAFLEAAPQLILQLTILLSNPDKTVLPSWIQIVSMCCSFLSMTWTITSYYRNNRLAQDDESNIGIFVTIFQFLWHICVTVSRIITISILASQWPKSTISCCFVHWSCMTLWLIVEPLGIPGFCGNLNRGAGEQLTLKEKIRSWLLAAVFGFVHIFIYLNPAVNGTLWRRTYYFLICLIENVVGIIIWYKFSDQPDKSGWYFEILILLVIHTSTSGSVFLGTDHGFLHFNPQSFEYYFPSWATRITCCLNIFFKFLILTFFIIGAGSIFMYIYSKYFSGQESATQNIMFSLDEFNTSLIIGASVIYITAVIYSTQPSNTENNALSAPV